MRRILVIMTHAVRIKILKHVNIRRVAVGDSSTVLLVVHIQHLKAVVNKMDAFGRRELA
jgi:hypothetical protein